MQVMSVTFEKKGGIILECMSVLLLFEICMKLLPVDWNKLPFSKLPMDSVYIFESSDA